MTFFRIKNWETFQHYKDRNPPWIKLHRELLTSETWVSLDDPGRVLAIACMMLAAATENKIRFDAKYVQRVAYLHSQPDFQPLFEIGFIEMIGEIQKPASAAYQTPSNARPEAESEGEKEIVGTPARAPDSVFERGEQLARIIGWDQSPNWHGDYSRLRIWLDGGWDFDIEIKPTIERLMKQYRANPARKAGDLPSSLKYFEKAIADAHAARKQPLPKGNPDGKALVANRAGSPGKSERGKAAIFRGLGLDSEG